MSKIVLASGNIGKLRELSQILSPLGLELIAQSDLNVAEAEETGLSFVENAIIKARNAALYTGLPAIADDSGIEVDALHGAPGIYSSRYAGPDASDTDNIEALLEAMKDVPETERTARFQCVVVFMRHAEDPTPLICQGSWQGQILQSPLGDEGFGYDPVFWVSETDCTAAELSPEQKHAISHRGKAMRQFMEEFKYTRHQP
ncbi:MULTISPECIES: RdgB/HAM1 family non-canonical purine NTP pyrophosphatase [unclassified Methylophaga]|jgi:XTP/dITP diphosphohydrolase|uniref:dITP/XTP pyrophosphatase n=3 Tax=Gammaproteobacteria TaxID=1236 RepID=A0A2T4CZC0_9GAMM|nr:MULTISPECIES: RdgB/HAM1 family non-canonical purine NTP pyrophosphatase [unclassified Methylophaga]PTB86913.1 non-canonical purine NTP pyrophosphatase, RdgB/HAM1 family [Pseudidiomarina aestuarii]MAL50812.1 non-canonical purine NTP pyrophosphatase, RdgB/HAM1 family [Methylophaga sp.]MBP24748.1 non-canonical purine NTP pyrophosphatase, RdgB/HAM1 family [Methylophaga sp.]MDX1748895.1 RdgB/HAM1 family non-canonical purine NTP pyrophosphatase [Methylophaga sp.]HCC80235.1 non-canonical purine NT|tara:strand:- start:4464 stop:5069 length:606 start_codon:yes stop_codon:yes gene_type:complete